MAAHRQVMTTTSTEPEWLTIAEAAEHLKCSTKSIRRWITAGDLHAQRFGPRLIRIQASSLAGMGSNLVWHGRVHEDAARNST